MSKMSAMPIRKKIEFLGQEVFRRLHNTKHEVENSLKVDIMNKFMIQLKMSGYNEFDRLQILKSGFNSYDKLKMKEEKGIRPFYRNRYLHRSERGKKKAEEKHNWYNKNNPKKYSSVFFVPATPGSKLLKMLKKTEAENQIDGSSRIKFIETSGRKLIDQLRVNDPFVKKCEKEDKCLVCDSSQEPTNCKVTNVGYTITCKTCKERNITKAYEGETCRNAYLTQFKTSTSI